MDVDAIRDLISDKEKLGRILLPIALVVIVVALVLNVLDIIRRDATWTMIFLAFAVIIIFIGETYMERNRNVFRDEADGEAKLILNMQFKELLFRLALWVPVPIVILGFVLFKAGAISFATDSIVKVIALAVYCAAVVFIFMKQRETSPAEYETQSDRPDND
ncbi:MAG: hypothetical protein LBU30_02445 [Candidatus Methanoplasma sp.]|jgi:TRAP-type uncharacterized transport system fused permease subunit|nr:hypothetical protein [Candidatus Methanoplasma sp.]